MMCRIRGHGRRCGILTGILSGILTGKAPRGRIGRMAGRFLALLHRLRRALNSL